MEIISIIEIIGVITFGMSGAILAVQKDLDYYGIAIFALITATGGGIVRDILINEFPVSLANPFYALLSLLAAVVAILFYNQISRLSKVLQIFDAFGLAAFTASGAKYVLDHGFDQPYVVITLAILTGTGGGTLRDVFAKEIPYVFQKEIYAVASFIGVIAYLLSMEFLPPRAALYICFGITLAVRLVSLKKDLHLRHVAKEVR
ncbi:trimeric intracellular cation channel family protein [Anaerotalea alkaliphila]|uniref:Trimeric intracellular cation channel family protein n=1 Tax=Anaerotalea alkaliphila TaxID=2662126 RepID=A0A7X5HVP5_9FIRM|nr:trimeric intracellular cation channel family protein [Anaerotalea alkaliphila]NDL67522.1 trimeric intracellular cation channel family protein [Anaerotalea alkaliphila]